ncbi:YheC/YheD family protein [Neobacillus terrae]|uniref:YheC/YheD family protein n=1 Tax=Neobacillus terrae TaxID=3034837 RepID=UPI0014079255|nr:YheC/YheD family protein [Neobacillus terrae]NHM31143.1 YheC/YheD family protein [Neobacillus terrae]
MKLIGMLHYRKKPHNVKKAYACASVSKMDGIDFVYFSYRAVDFCRQKIFGWVYKDGDWIQQEVDFPDTIINISAPKTREQSIVKKALKRRIPFISHSIGTKMKVFKKIKKGRQFSNHLIPSFNISNSDQVLNLMQKFTRMVIKPHSGSKGRSIYFFSLLGNNTIHCISGIEENIYSFSDFKELVDRLIYEQKYLVQPYIECKTKTGLAYDFRLHVQKNALGKWAITLIYPRISGNGKLTSNISNGGYRGEFIPFLVEEFGDKYFDIKQMLEYFAVAFATHFDSLYQKRSFDELGIDIGIDQNHRIWIFEVNWRPGSKHREFSVAKNMVPYAQYIADSVPKE